MTWLVDISRLIENLHLSTPTGIDRVEMAYVQHALHRADGRDVRFVATWPHFTGLLPAGYVRSLIDAVSARWAAGAHDAQHDQAFRALSDMLRRPVDQPAGRHAQRIGAAVERAGPVDWLRTASVLARSAVGAAGGALTSAAGSGGTCYLHTSQFRLNRSQRFEWLKSGGVASLFVLHDLIPVTHPEYCRPGEAQRHAARIATMARRASVIVANSRFTRGALEDHLAAAGVAVPPCEVVPLGLSDIFFHQPAAPALATATPYFVAVGTIEPRKNLTFLLQAWHRWTRAGQCRKARLVIVGRRGWENESVIDQLERSPGLAPTVIEVATLSDAGMVALLRGATALLAPSLVEGFGLPVAEALALGVPVIASSADAHREVGGSFAEYLDPTDGPGWMAALDDYVQPSSARRLRRVAELGRYRPATWSEHMARVEDIVSRIAPPSS